MLILLDRAHCGVDTYHLEEEFDHVRRDFCSNGYTTQEVKQGFECYGSTKRHNPEKQDLLWGCGCNTFLKLDY